MVQVNPKETSLFEEVKNGFTSLFQQAATVFAGLAVMLLVTGGNPSNLSLVLSFCLGTGFVAWSEQKRIQQLRNTASASPSNNSSNNASEKLVPKITAVLDTQENIDNNIYFSGHGIHKPKQSRSLIVAASEVQELLKQLQALDLTPSKKVNYMCSLNILAELIEKLKDLYPNVSTTIILVIHRYALQLLHSVYESPNEETRLTQREKLIRFLEAISNDINSIALEGQHENSSALPQRTLSCIP
jgi:hypothetical protein